MRSSSSAGRIQLWAVLATALAATAVSLGVFLPALATGAEGITMFSGSSAGAIVSATNSGAGGTGLTATAGNAGFALQGAIGATNTGVGVRGVVYGPGSTALIGEAKNTNLASPSTGLKGYSKSGNGVIGQTFANALPASTSEAGVLGQDLATPSPSGTPTNNAGVKGTSLTGIGVRGISQANLIQPAVGQPAAIVGTSNSNFGIHGISISNKGVRGTSTTSTGVDGDSSSGVGVKGGSNSGIGLLGESSSNTAVYGLSSSDTSPALYAAGGSGGASSTSNPLLTVHSRNTGIPCNGSTQANIDVMSVDQQGNIKICGAVTSGQPLVITRSVAGATLGAYAARQSQPTIEDFGQGRLVNGQGYVAIEPRFATTIDPRANYLVFITPRGDTNGLYVAQATPAGFSVRENRGGRSTVAFDYRIVAKPYDTNAPRLPLASSLPHPRPATLRRFSIR